MSEGTFLAKVFFGRFGGSFICLKGRVFLYYYVAVSENVDYVIVILLNFISVYPHKTHKNGQPLQYLQRQRSQLIK